MYKNNIESPFTWDIFQHQERRIVAGARRIQGGARHQDSDAKILKTEPVLRRAGK